MLLWKEKLSLILSVAVQTVVWISLTFLAFGQKELLPNKSNLKGTQMLLTRDKSLRKPPQHNTKGSPCNIADNCVSGKPAFYIVGKKLACEDHREVAFQMTRTSRPNLFLPEVGAFEPEIEVIEVEELTTARFERLAQSIAD
jgi:hypothetical protein